MRETSDMNNARLILGLAAMGSLGLASLAAARVFPGNRNYGYNNGYYDPGGWGGYVAPNPMPEIAAQQRELGQQQAMQQSMAMQSGIRSAMMTQSQAQVNARLSQRQQNRDWWFQHQTQQMAQQRARQSDAPTAVGCGFECPAAPKAATDIIRWPALLQDPAFASLRTQIEAPYRRSPPGLSVPTAEDYRLMVKTAEEMKGVLEWMTQQGVDTQEYKQANAFLDTLQREARDRSELGASPKSES